MEMQFKYVLTTLDSQGVSGASRINSATMEDLKGIVSDLCEGGYQIQSIARVDGDSLIAIAHDTSEEGDIGAFIAIEELPNTEDIDTGADASEVEAQSQG